MVRLTERETAAWCIVRGIDYLVDECPMAAGNKHLAYKAALNTIEETSPGSKASFYFNFIDNMSPLLAGRTVADGQELGSCSNCGAPTTGSVCAFCRLVETVVATEVLRPGQVLRLEAIAPLSRSDRRAARRAS